MVSLGIGLALGALVTLVGARFSRGANRGHDGRYRLTQRIMYGSAVVCCIGGAAILAQTEANPAYEQAGAILLQTGLATLVIGFISFELLVDERVPEAVFRHGYFRIANRAERERLLKSSIGALVEVDASVLDDPGTLLPTYYLAVRDFLEQTFTAPARYQYRADVALQDRGFCERPVEDLAADEERMHPELLTVEITYGYAVETNRLPNAVRVNGDGVVHRVDVWIPSELWLYGYLQRASSIDPRLVRDWILSNMQPSVAVSIDGRHSFFVEPVIDPREIRIAGDGSELRLQFPVCIDIAVPPGANMRVRYAQRSPARPNGEHHWVAFGATHGFRMRHVGFQESGFGVIPMAETTPWSKHSGGSPEEPRATVATDGSITVDALVFPGATFGYSWYRAE